MSQLEAQLKRHGFTPDRAVAALFAPPSTGRFWLRTAQLWERTGRRFAPWIAGGVLMVEASKQVYAPTRGGLGAVVRSIEPDFNLVECLGPNNHCRLTGGCALTCILNGALKAFWQHLDCYTLADVIARPGLPVLAQWTQPIAISR